MNVSKTIIAGVLGLAPFGAMAGIVDDVKAKVAPDKRQVVFEVSIDTIAPDAVVVRGVTSENLAKEALMEALKGVKVTDSLTVYPYDEMGLIMIPAASLRTRPAHAGEMATQAVMGTPVRLLEHSGEWYRVQTPDGYIAWVPDSSVAPKTAEEMNNWRKSDHRYVVGDVWQTRAYYTPDATGPRDVVTDLVLGAIVEAAPAPEVNGRMKVVLPDGRMGWADKSVLVPIAEWGAQTFNPDRILDTAYSMEGTPYLWGGTSTKAIDCSGLAKVSYLSNGIILMRDASQQALTGTPLDPEDIDAMKPGDLLFFGNRETGRITHVAIYDGDGKYVHSSGRVKRNSLRKDAPDYLYSPIAAVRIDGNINTTGITQVRNHPWYWE